MANPVMKSFNIMRMPGEEEIVYRAFGSAMCDLGKTLTVFVSKPDNNLVGQVGPFAGGQVWNWWMDVGAIPPEQYGTYSAWSLDSDTNVSNTMTDLVST